MPGTNGGQRHQPWPPSTEDDLRQAISVGTFEERHFVDIKRELKPGQSANKELAADLASFAIDGGRLIYGIDESAGKFDLYPIPLKGLAARIAEVALTRVDEPLDVEFTTIPDSADPQQGYLVVTVPLSPRAPHMAGHRYWGRTDKTKYPLSDAEATRLIERRARWAIPPENALNDWLERDPVPVVDQKLGHLHMVCIPVPQGDELMLPLFGSRSLRDWLTSYLNQTPRVGGMFSPDLTHTTAYAARTPRGWACASVDRDAAGHMDWHRENGFIELEVAEEGPVFLRSGRVADFAEGGKKFIIEVACLGLAYQMVSLTAALSSALDFSGNWDYALAITNIDGAISYLRPAVGLPSNNPVYGEYQYRKWTRASGPEIKGRPGAVVNRLLSRFMRAIGIDQAPQLQELMGRKVPVDSAPLSP